jgi:hypothetical protein
MKRFVALLLTSAVALALLPCPAAAQAVKASFIGAITDSSGATVPDAQITILETRTGISRRLSSGPSGAYSAPNMDPGLYRITVEKIGFRTVVRDSVELLVNSTQRVDVEIQRWRLQRPPGSSR